MATVNLIKAAARPRAGKGAARAARLSGKVPGVVYGDKKPPTMVLLDHAELRWVTTAELDDLDWLPADRQLLPAVARRRLPSND